VEAAVAYYGEYRDEIDEEIALNEGRVRTCFPTIRAD
jgi:hypothetical protein